jgi:hypothetical protein
MTKAQFGDDGFSPGAHSTLRSGGCRLSAWAAFLRVPTIWGAIQRSAIAGRMDDPGLCRTNGEEPDSGVARRFATKGSGKNRRPPESDGAVR